MQYSEKQKKYKELKENILEKYEKSGMMKKYFYKYHGRSKPTLYIWKKAAHAELKKKQSHSTNKFLRVEIPPIVAKQKDVRIILKLKTGHCIYFPRELNPKEVAAYVKEFL